MPLRRLACALVVLSSSACIFQSERRPDVDVNVLAATSHVFRGQTMTNRPVVQAATAVHLATADGGTGSVGSWGNLDLTDETGRAWFDAGHAGEFTQIDLWASYARRFGGVDATVGLRYYDWPNGEQFPFTPFPSTSEAFAEIAGDVAGFRPSLTAHYDIDEVTSLYVLAALSRSFELSKSARLDVQAWLGWSDEDHSLWLYVTEEAAFADVGGRIGLGIELDPVTTLQFAVAGSTIVDSGLREWFDGRVDPEVVWGSVGVVWAF